jgi:hypothetical protein
LPGAGAAEGVADRSVRVSTTLHTETGHNSHCSSSDVDLVNVQTQLLHAIDVLKEDD